MQATYYHNNEGKFLGIVFYLDIEPTQARIRRVAEEIRENVYQYTRQEEGYYGQEFSEPDYGIIPSEFDF